ncbi:MAG TPA: 6-bladed beta-propeller [Anaerolineae bacterium]|nr:6-bladed beta-propeller [Anaerolineae bacterium]
MSTASETPSSDSTETINCPHCGAVVSYERGATSVLCHYCGQPISVPHATTGQPPSSVMFSVMESTPTEVTGATLSRKTSTGCIVLVVGFVVFMILVTVVLPIVLTQQALNSIPDMPAAMKDLATTAASVKSEPTRRSPTAAPSPTPTPGYADIALQFGDKGMGPGQFTNAHLSGVDGEGRVYVGEYTGGRVQVFDDKGKYLKQFFVGSKKTDLLGFAVDRDGVVYVADGGDITRWDGKTGKALGKIKYSGGPGFGELALAPDGSLYAMWYERRNGVFTSVEGAREDLVHFDATGKVLNVVKGVISSMTDSVELDNALVVDGRGNVDIAAEFEQTIFKFDSTGKFITRIGSSGEGASQFTDVGAIAVDGQGRIYVVENGDIAVLKPDGSRLGKIAVDGAPRCLFFDDAGALWVTTDDGVVKYQVNQK